jgi:CheY-like chemotaxis protein
MCKPWVDEGTAGRVVEILVLDDDELIRRALVRRLGRDGHRVSAAGSAAEVQGGARVFDLAVVDIHFGVDEGIAVAEELLATGRVRAVVFFTSARDPQVLARALRSGPVVHDIESLRAAVAAKRPPGL